MTNSKPTETPLKQRASKRNWNKFRLLGITLNEGELTKDEQQLWAEIKYRMKLMLINWDENTELLLDTTLKEFKCCCCANRSNVPRLFRNEYYCRKHYQILVEPQLIKPQQTVHE